MEVGMNIIPLQDIGTGVIQFPNMTGRGLPRSRGVTKYFAVITIFMKYSLPEKKLLVAQFRKQTPNSHGNRIFITLFTNAHHVQDPVTKLRSMPFI
jgi:hypothetical protein